LQISYVENLNEVQLDLDRDAIRLTENIQVMVVKRKQPITAKNRRNLMVPVDSFTPAGRFTFQIVRKGNVIYSEEFNNLVTTGGKNAALDIVFRNQTQIAAWYIGLVNNAGWTAFDAGDTMSSHSGWAEFTSYSQSTRVSWTTVAASGGSISNTTQAQFDITASGTLKGIFVTSGSAKGGTTGTLWSAGAFSGVVNVDNGDQLKIIYTVNS
jgi:hypothetical protein